MSLDIMKKLTLITQGFGTLDEDALRMAPETGGRSSLTGSGCRRI